MIRAFKQYWICALGLLAAPAWAAAGGAAPELLFRVSADRGFTADVARGDAEPNFRDKVRIVPNGARGGAIEWSDDGILAWNAPGNIHAQRGTLAFFWRPRYAVGEAPFVIFRVGYADHTSWDMAWLRIDWNGKGFDAFVTDANLARTRVSFALPAPPAPDAWTHLAFAWDETLGVRFYVNGREAARLDSRADYDAGLDQLGLAARVLAPHQVQSRYNFLRGSDVDEIRVYDRMLDATGAAALVEHREPASAIASADPHRAWLHRHGWEGQASPALTAPTTSIRVLGFTDARDKKQWMWRAIDGIAETTWPGVYNRSRLAGRDDYFQLPDWNTYVEGGIALDLAVPEETFNRIEIRGAAFGDMSYGTAAGNLQPLFVRSPGVVRSVHEFEPRLGGHLRFTNQEQETPIQQLWAYRLSDASEPQGTAKLVYTIQRNVEPDHENLATLREFITGRYPADERSTVVALPPRAPARPRIARAPVVQRPVVHVLIPAGLGAAPSAHPLMRSWAYGWENMHDGLDGIAIDLPALDLPPTHDGLIPLNIRVKDPIWPARDMIDVSVSVRPKEKRTVWLDLRDRILTEDSLYLTIASAALSFDAAALDGAQIRLVFKARKDAVAEHVADRFNQVKDNWGFLVEEHTTSKRQGLYRRVHADISDLLRVDPDHMPGRVYWDYMSYGNQAPLPHDAPVPPRDVPAWAFWQTEELKQVRHFINWWIDQRQVEYGDFGGGISDDSDMVQQWPGLALMGVDPDKVNASLIALADAAYDNGMVTDGLSTIETDELHAYEEGINSDAARLYLNWGDPLTLTRMMTTVKAFERVIEPNPNGHLLFSSNWFGGRKIYREPNWQWQKPYSFPFLHPALLLGGYNADPRSRAIVTGLADGYLAHAYDSAEGNWVLPNEIQWSTGKTRGGELLEGSGGADVLHTFWAAWRWSGDERYLKAIDYCVRRNGPGCIANLGENVLDARDRRADWGKRLVEVAQRGGTPGFAHFVAWETTGDKRFLEALAADGARRKAQRMYLMTEGHWWSDRVTAPSEHLQRARLGGVALWRNQTVPGNTVSWRFADPEGAVTVGVLLPQPRPDRFKVIAYNLGKTPQRATMTGWNVTAGRWRMRQGIDTSGNDVPDRGVSERQVAFEKSASVDVVFPPRRAYVIEFELEEATDPVELRPDLGIGRDDVRVSDDAIEFTVHSLGHVATPAGVALLQDVRGRELARTTIPPLPAPNDLIPKTAVVRLPLPAGVRRDGARLRVMLEGDQREVTLLNNLIDLPRSP